jgi:monoamine oxidase
MTTDHSTDLPQDLPDPSPQPAPGDAPPVPAETLAVPREGLDGATRRKRRVVVVGAGLAGLAAGFELKRQGHDVIILEAQNRVGGRIHTIRSFAPGLYAEAGGMRIPRVHDLTLRYCELFGLPMRPFVMGNPKGLVHVGGVRMTAQEANADPSRLGFELEAKERGRTSDQLWESAIGELREMVEREGDAAWDHIVREFDQFSLYEYLRHRGWSSGAIEYFAVMNSSSQTCTTRWSRCCGRNWAAPIWTWRRSLAAWIDCPMPSSGRCSRRCASAPRCTPSTKTPSP